MRRLPETIFYVSTGRHLGASEHDTVALLKRERDARNASSSMPIGACVRVAYAVHISNKNSDNFEPNCHDD